MTYYRQFTFMSPACLPNPLCLSYINISASFPLLISHNLPPSFLTFHNLFWPASLQPRHYRPNSYKNIFKNTAQNVKNLPANRQIHFDSYQINPGHNRGSIYSKRRFNSCQLFCIGPQAHQAWGAPFLLLLRPQVCENRNREGQGLDWVFAVDHKSLYFRAQRMKFRDAFSLIAISLVYILRSSII